MLLSILSRGPETAVYNPCHENVSIFEIVGHRFADSGTVYRPAAQGPAAEISAPLCVRLRQPGHSRHVRLSAQKGGVGYKQDVGGVFSRRAPERDPHVG